MPNMGIKMKYIFIIIKMKYIFIIINKSITGDRQLLYCGVLEQENFLSKN